LQILRSKNPKVKVVIAKIIPSVFIPNNTIIEVNKMIEDFAINNTTVSSPIYIADMSDDITLNDLYDGVHPNDKGDRKIARKWFEVIKDFFI
jgi:lysophospholipase L1-like esterase